MDLSGKTIFGHFAVQDRLARSAGQSVYQAIDARDSRRCFVSSSSTPWDLLAFERVLDFELPGVAELRHHGNPLGISDMYVVVEAEPLGLPMAAVVQGPIEVRVAALYVQQLRRVIAASRELRGAGLPGLHPLTVYGAGAGPSLRFVGALVRHSMLLAHTSSEWPLPVYSLHFEAPEILLGIDRRRSPAADVYTLGALLAWMVSGSFPFGQRSTMEIIRAHATGAFHGCVVPAAAAELVAATMSPRPDARPSLTGLLRLLSVVASRAAREGPP